MIIKLQHTAALGDEPEQVFSQKAIKNINRLLKLLKNRLASQSASKREDGQFVNTSVFSTETLVSFLVLSLSEFNQTPNFSAYTFEYTNFVDVFHEVLVEGATLQALASQALIERGREFTLSDTGVVLAPPNISDLLTTQFQLLSTIHLKKLKAIKSEIHDFDDYEDEDDLDDEEIAEA